MAPGECLSLTLDSRYTMHVYSNGDWKVCNLEKRCRSNQGAKDGDIHDGHNEPRRNDAHWSFVLLANLFFYFCFIYTASQEKTMTRREEKH